MFLALRKSPYQAKHFFIENCPIEKKCMEGKSDWLCQGNLPNL